MHPTIVLTFLHTIYKIICKKVKVKRNETEVTAMNYAEKIMDLAKMNNGVVTSAQVTQAGIMLERFLERRLSHGSFKNCFKQYDMRNFINRLREEELDFKALQVSGFTKKILLDSFWKLYME